MQCLVLSYIIERDEINLVLAELTSELFLPLWTFFMGSPITKVGFWSLVNFKWLKFHFPRCSIYRFPPNRFSNDRLNSLITSCNQLILFHILAVVSPYYVSIACLFLPLKVLLFVTAIVDWQSQLGVAKWAAPARVRPCEKGPGRPGPRTKVVWKIEPIPF